MKLCYYNPLLHYVTLYSRSMTFTQLMRLIGEKKGSILLAGIFIAAVSFFVTAVTAPRFKVTTDFMVVQANSQSQDFYTLFKSSEYLGRVLSESIWSERFINNVFETGQVSKETLPFDPYERLKTWRKMVSIDQNTELGMLTVTVKADTEKQASKVMQAVSDVLINKNVEFRGGDEKAVEIRVLSGPIIERNPTPKELVFIVVAGFLAGASLMILRVTLKGISRGY